MPYQRLHHKVIKRLDEGGRGDRGWFLITRVHLTPARLKDIVTYLSDAGTSVNNSLTLSAGHYKALGNILDISRVDPGFIIRRHHFLAMEKPLNLLRRADGRRWRRVYLTDLAEELAKNPYSPAVLEEALRQIRFCKEPWYTRDRVTKYSEFNIFPYLAALTVMNACDGWIDRNEFDLFLSRVRNRREVTWAIQCINDYRDINPSMRRNLLNEVKRRIPGRKEYQNWRDMGMHTFSLLGLGTSTVRLGDQLVLTASGVTPVSPKREPRTLTLRVPEPTPSQDLETPPLPPEPSSGTDGELLIGKLLEAEGWEVVFYTNRRGFGFDIWAKKGNTAIVVEVKSSLGRLGTIVMTRLEYEAAEHHGENYILVTVENLDQGPPTINLIQNPVSTISSGITRRRTTDYHIPRRAWKRVAEPRTI